jgi:hypothetical protein
MKINPASLVLMYLVSALAFMSQIQQSKACPPCPNPNDECLVGRCFQRAPIAPESASDIDLNTCKVYLESVTCGSLTMPKKGFEALIGALPQ